MNDKMRKNLLREHKKRFEQEFGNVLAVKQRLKTEVGESNKRYQQHQAGADPDASAQWKDQITAFEQESNRLDNKLNRIIATTDSL
jgi:seryl-tRNA synthetase